MSILLETDYLIIGAGATGIAFVDEFINSCPNIKFIIVDKHAKPGGHWNDAYDFVNLHQPAAFYGVNSRLLGEGGKDLVSGIQILAYYELVMKDLLTTGRVEFYPQCEYLGNGIFVSLMDEDLEYKVKVLKKTVDAKYVFSEVPSVVKPEFVISDGVNCVPVNGLSRNQSPWKKYSIIGGGKTGIDAVLFLLEQKVNPDRITWIVPNDVWLLIRPNCFHDRIAKTFINMFSCIMESEDHDELFEKWESKGLLTRLDKNIKPTRYKQATVTIEEMETLRRIKNVIREGRIGRIETSRIIFKNGSELETDTNTLHVDCSADGSKHPPKRKIFDGTTIFLQTVKDFQPVYSASVIAAYESRFPDEEEKKNELCKAVPHSALPFEYLFVIKDTLINEDAIGKVLGVSWVRRSRLHQLQKAPFLEFLRLMIYMGRHKTSIMESLNKIINKIDEQKGA